MSSKDNFGDRMKEYERLETDARFIPLLPIYARIDGRGFSKFTKGMQRPYDPRMQSWMINVTCYLVEQTGAKIGYTQSDEISLVWQQEEYHKEIFFAGKKQKMISTLSAMASSYLMYELVRSGQSELWVKIPTFDCRVFQLPNQVEATNVILWREKDATKNAISQAARSFYSHKQLEGKKSSEMQEMMFQKGQNFNDYPAAFKRGTFVRRELYGIEASNGEVVTRSRITPMDMPPFGKVANRVDVIFNNAEPILITE